MSTNPADQALLQSIASASANSILEVNEMSTNPADQALLQSIASASANSIDDVIQLMEKLDTALAANDGLRWFNLLYLDVTKQVRNNPPQDGWKDPVWIARLDVIFANLYFSALADFLNGKPIPSSWQALFEARDREDIDRIQFALAGMNAHINHDLSLALLQIDDELHKGFSENTPQHQDYEHVNDLLETVLPIALQFLATGIVGVVVQDAGKVGKMLAVWNIRVARDLAWEFAEHLRQIPGFARDIALKGQDQLNGAMGRALLIPIQ